MPQALLALVAWTLFAFAGAYRWTLVPTALLALALAVAARPPLLAAGRRTLDGALLACLAGVALQMVPLPAALRDRLSPCAAAVDRALSFAPAPDRLVPLSLDPAATAWALAAAVTLVVVFWSARAIVERHGLRAVSRGVAWLGIVLSVVVFVQRFSSPHHIYGFWAPIARTATPTPFGPYVNRNDLATWLLLAVPLVFGYAAARTVPRLRGGAGAAALERALDARTVLLAGAVMLMMATLVASLSRSGLAAILAALATLFALGRRQLRGTGSGALAAVAVTLLLLTLPFTDTAALGARLGDTLPGDVGGRVAIWRDSWRMARDFAATGLGAGAFARGMLAYQRAPLAIFFNHAHNEYLQMLAEGGLLVAVPAAVALASGLRQAVRKLREDQDALFWFRSGAVSGLVAVAIQSVWDTGLRMPANGVLFAVVAAIAVHDAPDRSRRPPAGRCPDAAPGSDADGRAGRTAPAGAAALEPDHL